MTLYFLLVDYLGFLAVLAGVTEVRVDGMDDGDIFSAHHLSIQL